MKPNYKFLSFFYDLLDVFYFNRKKYSPRTALIEMLPDKPIRVLDVCAGTCSNSILIARNKPQASITALDLSAEMLKIAEKKFQKLDIKNIETAITDAQNTGLPDNSFDIILLSLILHEISEDLRRGILNEAKRLLNENGKIVIIEWEQPKSLFQKLVFFPIKLLEPKGFKEFLKMDLAAYFQELGFDVLGKQSSDYTRIITLQ